MRGNTVTHFLVLFILITQLYFSSWYIFVYFFFFYTPINFILDEANHFIWSLFFFFLSLGEDITMWAKARTEGLYSSSSSRSIVRCD